MTSVRFAMQVQLYHRGLYAFKGVEEIQTIIQLTSTHLAARHYPAGLPSKKGRLVAPAQGLLCTLTMD